jgi:hypothetical protein
MRPIEDWGDSKYGARLAITVPRLAYGIGEIVILTIYLRRQEGAEQLSVLSRGPWRNYALTVRSGRGEPVPLSQFSQLVEERSPKESGRITLDLEPGAVLITTIPLNALFDITVPDSYVLSVSRVFWVRENPDPDRLESNEIEINISHDAATLAGEILLL